VNVSIDARPITSKAQYIFAQRLLVRRNAALSRSRQMLRDAGIPEIELHTALASRSDEARSLQALLHQYELKSRAPSTATKRGRVSNRR
jgi:hypothetical protein